MPINCMSNLSDGSTIVDALCILKDNDQPLFKNISTVLESRVDFSQPNHSRSSK